MPADDINKLTNLDTSGVSLVHRGANRRRIAFTKSEENMGAELKNGTLLTEVLKAGYEGEAAVLEAVKKAHPGIGEKEADAIAGSLRLLKSFQDSEAVKKAAAGLEGLLKGENPFAPKPEGEEEDEEVEMKKGLPAEVVKSLEPLPKEQRVAAFKALRAGQEAAEKERVAKAEERIAKAEREAAEAKAEVAKQEAVLKAERDARRTKEFVTKAEKELPHLPGKPEELGAVLKRLDDFDPKLREQVEGVFKASEAALKESGLFIEKGKGGDSTEESAKDAIAKAVEKKLKEEQAAA